MTVQEIAQTMSNLERRAIEAFEANAKAYDAFNQGAARIVRSLLQDNQRLETENEALRDQNLDLRTQIRVPHRDLDPKLVGGTD